MSQHRLPFRPLAYYSVGNFVLTAIQGFVGSFLLKFYAEEVHLGPQLVGYALLVGNIVDAAVDPAIGHWSDRTKSRWGRRRPFFLGTVPASILFVLLLMPPAGSTVAIFSYLTVIFSGMVVFLSLMGISHLAMALDLTDDSDQQTRIFGYKNFIENITSVIAILSVPIALSLEGTNLFQRTISRADCYRLAAAALGVSSILAALIAFWGTREHQRGFAAQRGESFCTSVRQALRNPAFVVLLVVFALLTIADRFTTAQFFVVMEHLYGMKEEDCIPLVVALFAGAIASVWPWVWLAQSFGKKLVLQIAIALWPIAYVVLAYASLSMVGLILTSLAMGIFGSGLLTVLGALVPDAVGYAHQDTESKPGGIYSGIGNVVCQIAIGVAFLLAGFALHFAGYGEPGSHKAQIAAGLRVSFSLGPILLALATIFALSFFPNRSSGSKSLPRLPASS